MGRRRGLDLCQQNENGLEKDQLELASVLHLVAFILYASIAIRSRVGFFFEDCFLFDYERIQYNQEL